MAVAKKKAKPAKKVIKRVTVASLKKMPKGFVARPESRVLVPSSSVVDPGSLRRGLAKAKDEIDGLIQEIVDISTTEYKISEIEFSASFSADGKFLGIGVGGSATVTFRIRPIE